MNKSSSIDEIAECIINAKGKCSFLVGAGCSVTAGIPLASGFVKLIKDKYRTHYENVVDEKTYSKCMEKLSHAERRQLIIEQVKDTNINWAHICLANLLKKNHVDRILTTNFDRLLIRALALLNEFPAVYDLAVSKIFNESFVPEKAIYYLHGQFDGFTLLNTEEECNSYAGRLRPVFEEAGRGRVWIIIGYSGENDLILDQLSKVATLNTKLFWVLHNDKKPTNMVFEKLLNVNRYAFYINGFDADSFLIKLAQKIGCFPPDFVNKPFSYLDDSLSRINKYFLPELEGEIDVLETPRRIIQTAAKKFENKLEIDNANYHFLKADYETVITLISAQQAKSNEKLSNILALSYMELGLQLYQEGNQLERSKERNSKFNLAQEKFEQSFNYITLYNEAVQRWVDIAYEKLNNISNNEAVISLDKILTNLSKLEIHKIKILLNFLSKEFAVTNNEKTILICNKLINIIKEEEPIDYCLLLEQYNRLANLYYNRGDYKNSLNFYELCLGISKKGHDKKEDIIARYNLAFNYEGLEDFDLAEKQYNIILKWLESESNLDISDNLIIKITNNILRFYCDRRKYYTIESLLNKLLDEGEKEKDEQFIVKILYLQIKNYKNIGQIDKVVMLNNRLSELMIRLIPEILPKMRIMEFSKKIKNHFEQYLWYADYGYYLAECLIEKEDKQNAKTIISCSLEIVKLINGVDDSLYIKISSLQRLLDS
ncbi:SIR2 family protein [Desulfosporosinus sp. SYSU MS00001]|uniref:SIR2 family protein n=1 Tax=Desulfosporosinus sp. SYSU MS00001 TaxID=3416284 RepID=UPI003CF13FFA